jgi:hypothetical protein
LFAANSSTASVGPYLLAWTGCRREVPLSAMRQAGVVESVLEGIPQVGNGRLVPRSP